MRLIDADELLEDVRQNSQSYWADDFAYEWVNRQPTVDAVPVRHGRWEKVRGHQMVRRCSECGDIMPRDRAFIHYIYCGHCGAKMDERKEE